MKIKNLNMKYEPILMPKAGDIWKGKPHIGGVYLIVETGNHKCGETGKWFPSKLSAVNLENNEFRLGTWEGQDGFDEYCFAENHDYVCHSRYVTLTFPKKHTLK
jgi:hypothetical protein